MLKIASENQFESIGFYNTKMVKFSFCQSLNIFIRSIPLCCCWCSKSKFVKFYTEAQKKLEQQLDVSQIHSKICELEVGIKFRHFDQKYQELHQYNERSKIINIDSSEDENNYKKVVVVPPIEDIDDISDQSFERKQKNYATPSNIRKSLIEENEGVMITFNKSHQPEILMHKHGQ